MALTTEARQQTMLREANRKLCVFITNPFSGTRRKDKLEALINEYLNHEAYTYRLIFTEYGGHATTLAREAAAEGAEIVVAVGGDGTVNEVATGLMGSETALAVLPFGSGNGFAYHLGIQRSIRRGFEAINAGHIRRIDTATANGRVFLNVAGLGLDAKVAFTTKQNTRRGFIPYFLQTLKESMGFRYMTLTISCPEGRIYPGKSPSHNTWGEEWTGKYAMAVVANASVYGYGFTVASDAQFDDGLFDVILVKKAPVYRYFPMAVAMLTRSFHKSPLVDYFRTPHIHITFPDKEYAHLDGEGFEAVEGLLFRIVPTSLNVIVHG